MAGPRQNEIEYDDDDYLPRDRSREAGGRGRGKLLLVLGAIGIVIGMVIVVFLARSERAVEQARVQVAQSEQSLVAAPITESIARPKRATITTKPAASAPRGKPAENWRATVGTWRRDAPTDGNAMWPQEFEFRENFTARSVHLTPTTTFIRENLVEVRQDTDESLTLVLHDQNGPLSYAFTMSADDTLILNDHGRMLTFTRVK